MISSAEAGPSSEQLLWNSSLPFPYANWMAELLGAPLPAEIHAACGDCRMAPPHAGACGCDIVFRADLKCCTFMPDIPNFLAGAILADDSPEAAEGRRLFERNAQAQAAVNPLGVFPPAQYASRYRFNAGSFGRLENLVCPYFIRDGGLCGIWRHRNGRCSTYFCKFERGAIGRNLWRRMDALLAALESSLAKWCLLQLDFETQALAELVPPSGYRIPATRTSWGKWAGKERELFRECWRLVEPLSGSEALQVSGSEVQLLAQLVQEAFRLRQNRGIPPRLRCGILNVEPMGAGFSRVWAYSLLDPVDLETSLVECLPMFSGGATDEVLRRIESEKGIQIGPELLQKLCDYQVLVGT